MRYIFAVLLLISAAAAQFRIPDRQVTPPVQSQADKLKQVIIEQQQAMTDAQRRGDVAYIAEHMTGDFREIFGDGNLHTRAEVLAAIPDVKVQQSEMSDFTVQFLGPDTALVTCRLHLAATTKGRPMIADHYRLSSIWVRRSGEWKLLFQQGTPIAAK